MQPQYYWCARAALTATPPPHPVAQVVVLLVVNNALQGILSSFFFKYADTILKKYSSTIATIFTGAAARGGRGSVALWARLGQNVAAWRMAAQPQLAPPAAC